MIQQMKFRDFRWPNNPRKLQMVRSRKIREWDLSFSGQTLQDFGCSLRTVSGEGEFFGEERGTLYERLEQFLQEGSEGILSIPENRPFFARLVRLERIGEPGPELLRYEFEFRESGSGEIGTQDSQERVYFCRGGENLWDIAAEYHTVMEELLKENPWIEWPNVLKEGERVVIP